MPSVKISIGAKLALLAIGQPDAPAVTVGERRLTYAELHRRTNRLARRLERFGVKQGDLVTVGLPNSLEFVEACWAIWKLGATPQPVSFRLPRAELEPILELARPPVVIGDFGYDLSIPRLGVADLAAEDEGDEDLLDRTAPILKAPTSGGSTGKPKLILSGTPGEVPVDWQDNSTWRMTPQSIALIPAPLYHNAGFGMMLAALTTGAHLVLMPRFDPEKTLAEIERVHATWIYLVPTMMNRIWQLEESVRLSHDVSSLTVLWHLAAPCPPLLKEAFIHWLGPDVVLELYAGTESQASTSISGREWLEHRGSVGRITRGEMAAFDVLGKPLPPRQIGEIYMRQPAGSPPTYHYLGATAKTLPNGWESLGDMGWFDEDGYLYLADRGSDMVLVGGSNVYPAEVEAALEEFPGVLSCAVIGLPDDDLGNRLHAILEAPLISEDKLRAHLRERLVTYKQPRSFEFVERPVRDDAGKVRRSELRAERLARAT